MKNALWAAIIVFPYTVPLNDKHFSMLS